MIAFALWVLCLCITITGIEKIFKDVKSITHQDIVKLCTVATILVVGTYLTTTRIAQTVQSFFSCA